MDDRCTGQFLRHVSNNRRGQVMAKTYRVGIIGRTGRGNYGHAVDQAFTKLSNVEIVAVADEHPAGRSKARERLNANKAYADYREMLEKEELDMVAICPRWIDQHYDMLMAAAEAGCHIYMEKPFCRTLEECDDVIRALEMRHLKLGIAHISEHSPVIEVVKSLIKDGVIGELLELRGRGKEDRRGGGEDLWVLGSHIFGLMRTIAGGDPLACTAHVWQQEHPVTRADVIEGAEGIGPLAGDHLAARYEFSGQLIGDFASKKNMQGRPSRFALQLFGSQGVIELQSGYLKPAFLLRDSSWSPGRTGKTWQTITSAGIDQPEPRTDGTYEGGHIAAIKDLMAAIEDERQTRCSAEDCRGIIQMIAAVFESHRQQKRVTFPLKTRVNPLTLLE